MQRLPHGIFRRDWKKICLREKEYKKDLKQLEGMTYTRARLKESHMEIHQLAPTDHGASKNHMIDLEGGRFPAKEPDWEKEKSERSHLHLEGGDACDQL